VLSVVTALSRPFCAGCYLVLGGFVLRDLARVGLHAVRSCSRVEVVLGTCLLLCLLKLVFDFLRQLNWTALLQMLLQRRMRLLQWIVRREIRHWVARVKILNEAWVVNAGLVVVLKSLAELLWGSSASQIQVNVYDEAVVLLRVFFAACRHVGRRSVATGGGLRRILKIIVYFCVSDWLHNPRLKWQGLLLLTRSCHSLRRV